MLVWMHAECSGVQRGDDRERTLDFEHLRLIWKDSERTFWLKQVRLRKVNANAGWCL